MGMRQKGTHPRDACVMAGHVALMGRVYFFAALTGSFTASNVANSTL